MREELAEKKIVLNQVFERPSEVSQPETEGGDGGEVFLAQEIVHINVHRLESQVSVGFFFGGQGEMWVQSPLLGTTGMFESLECDEGDCCSKYVLINTQS